MNGSTATAVAVLAALRRAKVKDVVLCPGSRSAALAIVMQQADAEGLVRLHVRFDERTAGFLALGLAKGAHRPVAVVTTSGSAVANLHPAALEASHVGETLLLLTADRPSELRGTGANQTTYQVGIFGPQVRCVDVAVDDALAAAAAVDDAVRIPGPTHVNLQFGEPLLPEALPLDLTEARQPLPHHQVLRPQLRRPDGSVRLGLGPRTVVVAGDDAGPPARLLAEHAGWPLLAEPTSGARTGTHAIRTYRLLLGTPLVDRIERVVVVGHPTLSRPVTRLISRSDIEVVSVVGAGGVATDPGRVARRVEAVPVVDGSDDPGWLDEWRLADAVVAGRLDRLAEEDPAGLPLRVAAAVSAAVTAGTLLVVGSSQPVRDLDLMADPYPAGERRLLIANRGLSGIDGTVSTAIGAALGRPSGRALAYLGDLTFLHDATGLFVPPGEPEPDLTLVVANDDGGSIFASLEQGAPALAPAFERVFGTPQGADLGALCAAAGKAYQRVEDAEALRELLAGEPTGIRVVEVAMPRADRRGLTQRISALVSRERLPEH